MMQSPVATIHKPSETGSPARAKGWMIALPAFIWLIVFTLLPSLIVIVFSLGYRDELGRIAFGLSPDNYLRFFYGPYLSCLWRSVLLAAGTTVVTLLLAFPTALWLSFSVSKKYQSLALMALTVPLWTSFLLRIYAWITILRPTGILTHALQAIGIADPPVILYTPWAVLLGMVYNYLPYLILPLYSTLEKLDKRCLEAARDLGANSWQTFLRVTVPLSMPGIVSGIIMVFVPSLGDYITPDLMGGAKNMYIGSLIQNQFLVTRDWAFGSAVSTVLLIIVASGVWIYLRYAGDEAAV